MSDPPSTAGPVALVTGASRGIGRALALGLARAGYDVAFTYRQDRAAAERTGKEITDLGRREFHRAANATDAEDAVRVVDEARSALGRLDTVIPNAGRTGSVGWDSKSPSEWQELLATLLVGPYVTVRAAAPELKRTRGSVVLVASSWSPGPTGASDGRSH